MVSPGAVCTQGNDLFLPHATGSCEHGGKLVGAMLLLQSKKFLLWIGVVTCTGYCLDGLILHKIDPLCWIFQMLLQHYELVAPIFSLVEFITLEP